jgi:hypothetical protein
MARMTHSQYLTDRTKANALLAQEYIEHFNAGSYFPEFNETADTDQGSWTVMSHFVFDRPRLSFTNSNIASSRARLAMRVVSGDYLSMNKPLGGNQAAIVSVAKLDPLTAPYLYMDIFLEETNGGDIDTDGRVLRNLSNASSFTFKLSSSEDRNRKLGEAVEKAFDKWDESRKVFELNRFVAGDGDLKPTSFAVATHSLARAGAIGLNKDEDQEEGAVIVGVAMNGDENGKFPIRDQDLPYLLPESPGVEDEPFSMNIMLNNDIWVRDLIGKMLRESPEFTAVTPDYVLNGRGFIEKIEIGNGSTTVSKFELHFNPPKVIIDLPPPHPLFLQVFTIDYPAQTFQFNDPLRGKLEILFASGQMTVKWAGGGARSLGVTANTGSGNPYRSEHGFNADWLFTADYAFQIIQQGDDKGKVGLVEKRRSLNLQIHPHQLAGLASHFTSEIKASLLGRLQQKFEAVLAILINAGVNIDALRLNNVVLQVPFTSVKRLASAMAHEKPSHSKGA